MVVNDSIVNGWNGDVTVASADDGRAFTIQLDNIPENACIKLGASVTCGIRSPSTAPISKERLSSLRITALMS